MGPRGTAFLIDLSTKSRMEAGSNVSYRELEVFKELCKEHNIDIDTIFPAETQIFHFLQMFLN